VKGSSFTTDENSAGMRLDVFVYSKLPELIRAFVGKLIEQGKVTVNGSTVTKTGYKVRAGDKIIVDYDLSELEQIPAIELPIIYEDETCVVINKPVGVLAHSKGDFNPEATVASWLGSRVKGMKGDRAGIVHRLDRATSGVMICAKTPAALAWLQKQFSQRKVQKTYIALVKDQLKEPEAIIDMPIERNPKAPATFRVGAGGRPALTHYKVIEASEHYSLLELKPTTGRTHQLRVHLAQIGHPIVGDTLYGGEPAERLFLHALELNLTLPSRERQIFKARQPQAFQLKLKS
jgi:23S rRNA pseudouridine1911/1915/1917 synthase